MRKKVCLTITLIVVSMGALPATAVAAPVGPQGGVKPVSVICKIMPWMCR